MHFQWDHRKARSNLRKHGVSFEEALTALFDPRQIAFYDPDHSDEEDREILLGHSNQGRLLVVVYTLRDESIRLISARTANRQEQQDYARSL